MIYHSHGWSVSPVHLLFTHLFQSPEMCFQLFHLIDNFANLKFPGEEIFQNFEATTIFIPSATRTWPTNLSSPCIFHPSLPSNISLGINLSWKRTKLVHRVLYEVSLWRILGKILLFRGRKFWSKRRKNAWFYRAEENNRDNER